MKQLPFVLTDLTISKTDFFPALSIIVVFNLEFLSNSWTFSKKRAASEYLSGSDFPRHIYWIPKVSVRKTGKGRQKKRNRQQELEIDRSWVNEAGLFKNNFKRGHYGTKKNIRCYFEQTIYVLEKNFQISAFQIIYGEGPVFIFNSCIGSFSTHTWQVRLSYAWVRCFENIV